MARLACLIFLVLALTACSAQEKIQTKYVDIDDKVLLGNAHSNRNEIISCKIINNNGTEFKLYPTFDTGKKADKYKRFLLNKYGLCEVQITKMTKEDSGLWKIKTTLNTTKTVKEIVWSYYIKVRMLHRMSILPEKINVYSDQQVSLRFHDRFKDLKSCELLSPEQLEYNVGTDKLLEMRKSGKCSVNMIVRLEHAGLWTLVADLNNNTAITLNYEIQVRDTQVLMLNRTYFTFKRGDTAVIEIGKSVNSRICIFQDPHGVRYPIVDTTIRQPCKLEIEAATEYHEGLWKVFYGLEGERNFNSSIIKGKNGGISLLCRIRGENMRFCSFVRPDGEILHMTYGVGNEKYEYYGNSLNIEDSLLSTKQTFDCGITIRKPSIVDYGTWKCLFRFPRSQIMGRIIKVTQSSSDASINTNVTAEDVYVKKDESFKIKCKTQELLSYCWLRSPNGTIYTVSTKTGNSKTVLKYKGEGLELGECGAEIEEASHNYHSGRWTCHMGVLQGPEIQGSFNIFVQDTHLMAAQDVVTVLDEGGETDLICQPLPGSNQMIEACRWVNPFGYGINVDNSRRYITETKATHCKLSIRANNVKDDMGKWICYARFVNAEDENSARIILSSKGRRLDNYSKASLSLILGILLSTSLVVILVLFYRIKLRSRRDDEEIILEKPRAIHLK